MDDEEILRSDIAEDLENVEVTLENCFSSLEDMVNSDGFSNPINKMINRSVGEIMIMIIKYALVNALSLTQIYEL